METKIYLLAGKARSGKDTAAKIITDYYETKGKRVVQIGFADYIKNYAMNITNWDGSDETKPRELLQVLGTDIVRNTINEDFFINRVCEDIIVYKHFFDVIIISGARFPNELDIPKARFSNVCIIGVKRDNYNDGLTSKQQKHITENALEGYNNYDCLIKNDGDLDSFKEKILKFIGDEK